MLHNTGMSILQCRVPGEICLSEYASMVWFIKHTSQSEAMAYEPKLVHITYEPLHGSLNVEP